MSGTSHGTTVPLHVVPKTYVGGPPPGTNHGTYSRVVIWPLTAASALRGRCAGTSCVSEVMFGSLDSRRRAQLPMLIGATQGDRRA